MQILRGCFIISTTLLAACSQPRPTFHFIDGIVYKLEVHQGNFLNQDAIDKLRVGMTPSQVQFLLGTPLLQDPFHAARWDYTFQRTKGARVLEKQQLTVFFENGRLARWQGHGAPDWRQPSSPNSPLDPSNSPAAID